MSVSISIEEQLSHLILTGHLNLLWYDKRDSVVDIKCGLIRHAENCVIIDELDLK
jgi:hypothetical protein